MAEIKFRCPECTQKIAVAASAAGVKIDCPTCHSRLVIPRSETAPVEVLIKRKLAIVGGSADAVYAELQKAEVQAEKAAEELKKLRADSVAAAQKAQQEIEASLSARRALETEVASLRPLRDQLAKTQQDLASAAEAAARLTAAQDATTALETDLAALRATHAETQERLAAITGQLAEAHKETERARSDAETMADAHRAQLDAAKGIETGVRAELSALQTQHTQAETQLGEHAAKLYALEAERTQLTGIVEELLPLREELAKSQRDLCAMCESAAEKARGYESKLEAANTTEAELRTSLAGLQTKHAELEKRATELGSKAEAAGALREQHASVQADLERIRAEAEKTALERDEALRKHEEFVAGAQTSEKSLREQASALEAKLHDAERRHAALSHGFSALKQERGDLTAELNTARKKRDDAAALVAEHALTIEKLTPALETARGELARLREEANAAAVEHGRLTATLEKAVAERGTLAERCKQLNAEAAAGGAELARLKQLAESTKISASDGGTQLQQLAARAETLAGIVAEKETATREALAKAEQHRTEHLAAQERAQKAERAAAEATERAGKSEAEKTAFAAEIARKSAELETLKGEVGRARAELERLKAQPKDASAGSTLPTDREKSLEAERDALATALERTKQHVSVLQTRRDMLRDEVATLRSRLGIGGKVTSGDEKPIAK